MKISVAVINDLVTDQRVHRTCTMLHEMGHEVTLIGRKRRKSPPMDTRSYGYIRMRLLFEKGALFYAFFNIRLFLRLLFSKFDAVWANDLDTLWACHMASKWKRKKIIYDSHEFFTEVPELQGRKFVKRFWERIERRIFPKLPFIITVNDSIARLYEEIYGKKLFVVRNVPMSLPDVQIRSREELKLPGDKKIIILQGSGINIDRGAEEAVQAMEIVENAVLVLVGGGDVFPVLHRMMEDNENLQQKVIIRGRVPREELFSYTSHADIGLTLDKSTNINYLYSLPNKVFDYLQAGTAVLCSDLPEVSKIVKENDCGKVISNLSTENIAYTLNEMLSDEKILEHWKKNANLAAQNLCWEKESKRIEHEIRQFLQ
ncbi:MAG: glycosyltransferase [Marinilabiliales bacterium]|nr:MAG: glycosyltransferase [Marinilabiliales bacterium]